MTHRPYTTALLAGALLAAAGGAQAADSASQRVVTGVGAWIAAQGNAALDQLQDDLIRNLQQRLRPLLPEAPTEATRKLSTDTAEPAPARVAL